MRSFDDDADSFTVEGLAGSPEPVGDNAGVPRLRRRDLLLGGAVLAAAAIPATTRYRPRPHARFLTAEPATAVDFVPGGDLLVSGGGDVNRPEGPERLWDLGSGRQRGTGSDRGVSSIARSADGRVLVTAGPRGARLRAPVTGGAAAGFTVSNRENTNEEVWTVALDGAGDRMAVAGHTLDEIDTVCLVWDLTAGVRAAALERRAIYCVRSVALSPDGLVVALAGVSGGQPAATRVNYAAPDAPGCWLWGLRSGNRWNLDRGELHQVSTAGYANAVAFSPDGDRLAMGSRGFGCRLWDAGSDAALVVITQDPVSAVAFSPDGGLLATAGPGTGSGMDRYGRFRSRGRETGGAGIRLWDSGTGRLLSTITDHPVDGLAFSPDGATIAGCTGDTGPGAPGCRLWPVG